MALTERLKQGFLRMPLKKQALLIASATLALSVVMPWYSQSNSFGIGDTYAGFQGPLFFVGMLVGAMGVVSFLNLFLPLLGHSFSNYHRKSGVLSLVLGAQSLLLLAVANSVFYHPDFGVNLSNKSTRFGMTVAFFSVGVMVIAGWFSRRAESSEVMDVVEPVVEPTPVYGAAPQQVRMDIPSQPTPAPNPATDPLTMDARTRYKLMQSRLRSGESGHAQPNFWGRGSGSAFSQRPSGSYSYGTPRGEDIPVDTSY